MENFCSNVGGNTGVPQCDLQAPVIGGYITTPSKNDVIPAGTVDVMTFLKGKFAAPTKGQRWFPIMGFGQSTDNTEEAVIGTLGYGSSVFLREGHAIYQMDIPFTLCKGRTISRFNNWNGGVFAVTTDGKIIGRKQENGDLKAFAPERFTVSGGGFGDGANVKLQSITVDFGFNNLFVERMDTRSMSNFDPDEFAGFTDVEIKQVASTATTLEVSVATSCGGVDLFDYYPTELATAPVWKLTSATGTAVTVSSVVANDARKTFTLTFAGTPAKVSLAPVDVLETNGIAGYESLETVIKPA